MLAQSRHDLSRYVVVIFIRSFRRGETDAGENPRLALQRFFHDDDGFIACGADDNLVLGVSEEDTGGNVCLMRRQADDIRQRWTINDNGYSVLVHLQIY